MIQFLYYITITGMLGGRGEYFSQASTLQRPMLTLVYL